jgi:hypothetical protein
MLAPPTLFGRQVRSRKGIEVRLESARPLLGRDSREEERRMGPRSIVNYVFIVVLAAMLAGGLYATWNMVQAALS